MAKAPPPPRPPRAKTLEPEGVTSNTASTAIPKTTDEPDYGKNDRLPPPMNPALPTREPTIITHQRIQELKHAISKLPSSDSKEFEHFAGFFYTFFKFMAGDSSPEDPSNVKLMEKYSYHLHKVWVHILQEFRFPGWFTIGAGVNEELMKKYIGGRMNIEVLKTRIQQAIDSNELPDFFAAYPYVKDLLIIDGNLYSFSKDRPDVFRDTMKIVAEYIDNLKNYENVFPLLVLKEHVHLMLGHHNLFDRDFYIKHMKGAEVCLRDRVHNADTDLMFLSLFIGKYIPHAIRKIEGFKQFNWDAFDGLYRNLFSTDKTKLSNILRDLEKYINELISFQLGELPKDGIHEVDVTAVELVNVEANLNPAFVIIDDYLRIVSSIAEDNNISRLATLRTITAIGEAINSIKLLIPEMHRESLQMIINLRDHIVHSSTYEASRFIDNLINNVANKTLVNVLPEIQGLQQFFNELKIWFAGHRTSNTFPDMPVVQVIREFEHTYTAARTKDDRSEKLSLANYKVLQDLIQTITAEEIDNPNYAIIEAFIRQGIPLDRDNFVEVCIGGHHNNNALRKIHDKIKEINKIQSVKQASQEEDFDFAKINLNLSKSDKAKLEGIKTRQNSAELQEFLEEHLHKQLERFNAGDFLNSVRRINLNPHKEVLKKFIEEGTIKSKELFNKAVAVVFNNDPNAIQVWHDAYTKFTSHIESIKRDQITQLEYSITNVELLKEAAIKIFDGRGIDIQRNPVISIACEMLYGFCSDNFKSINKFINLLHDYTDKTLYYSFIREHPIQEVKTILEHAIQARHQMFHFERVFNNEDIFLSRMIWFSMIENMTHGIFFPEAIVASPDGGSRQEMFSESTLQKLVKFMTLLKDDLGRSPDTLNMYMAMLDEMLPTAISVVSSMEETLLHRTEEKGTSGARLDTTWYDFQAIRDSLIKIINNNPEHTINREHILDAVTNNEQLNFRLHHHFEANSYYIVPLNVNALDGGFGALNHWVGLHVVTGEAGVITAIRYINPTGEEINSDLEDAIFTLSGVAPQDITYGRGIQFAYPDDDNILIGNINYCGPMLVKLLSELIVHDTILTHSLNKGQSIALGQQLRQEQRYDRDEHPIFSSLLETQATLVEEDQHVSPLPSASTVLASSVPDIDVPLIETIHVD